jgi:folate-binding protein YgfZ
MPDLDLTMPRARLTRARQGATVVVTDAALFRVTGAGGLTCLQGLLTNDLVGPGDGSLVYGALLTPKGAIVVDAWVLREGADRLTLVVPRGGREAALEIFRRTLPPRLARLTDVTDESRVAWLVGEHAFRILLKSGIEVPESAGRMSPARGGAADTIVALAPETAPFVALLAGPAAEVERLAGRLVEAGASAGEETDLHALRILAGWPALGLEIEERTLPQEVRYDEIGGVSYTKGCYTGQETVARLHFRGHTNRELRGLVWGESLVPETRAIVADGREVGTVRSTLTLEDRSLGLAMLRREIEPGEDVVASGRQAVVVRLPFESGLLDA